MATFPDATVVFTHRDPVSTTASLATMIAYAYRLHRETVDVPATGRFWADWLVHALNASMTDRDVIPPGQAIDVMFPDFMADQIGTVAKINDRAAQPFPSSSRAAVEAYQAEHGRGRHGAVRYDLADFDLRPEDVRRATQQYMDRFGVSPEWPSASP